MSASNQTKINKLLQKVPYGVVLSSSWLTKQGYSPMLIRNYRISKWLESFGHGANIRYEDKVDYLGGIYSLQHQLKLSAHPGGRTALALLGRTHYLEMNQNAIYLFGQEKEVLPNWFRNNHWEVKLNYSATSFLPTNSGLVEYTHKNFSINISNPTRAILECLYLAPQSMSIEECYEILQGLNNLQPTQIQELLENCKSIKVKRLFFYLAEKVNHTWFKYLNFNNIDLGKGNRSLVKTGVYIPKHKIIVPKELEENELPSL